MKIIKSFPQICCKVPKEIKYASMTRTLIIKELLKKKKMALPFGKARIIGNVIVVHQKMYNQMPTWMAKIRHPGSKKTQCVRMSERLAVL